MKCPNCGNEMLVVRNSQKDPGVWCCLSGFSCSSPAIPAGGANVAAVESNDPRRSGLTKAFEEFYKK